jgi:hypothetical protein
MKKVIFTNVDYIGNVGDYWASPTHYYDFPFDYEREQFVQICNDVRDGNEENLPKDSIVIVGGGGLIVTSTNYLQKGLQNIIDNNKCVIWALGSNTTVTDDRLSWDFLDNKNILMCGLRDTIHGLNRNYIPCVSSKHKIFDKYINKTNKGEGFGILEHVDYNVPIDGVDKIKNNCDIEELIDFIDSKEYLVSTTYHGLYWSQLLGKKVVYFNEDNEINTKFINIRNRVHICNRNNYKTLLENSCSLNGLIKESRFLNDIFYKQLIKSVNNN